MAKTGSYDRTRFVQIPVWVIESIQDRGRLSTVLPVYSALYRMCDFTSRQGEMFDGWQGIQDLCGVSRPAIYRALAELKEIGALEERSKGVFFLPLDPPESLQTEIVSPNGDEGVSKRRLSPLLSENSYSGNSDQNSDTPLEALPTSSGISSSPSETRARAEDPNQQLAQDLTKLAFAQPTKPLSSFVTVRARILNALEAGRDPEVIRAKIISGELRIWTNAAMELVLGPETVLQPAWEPSPSDLNRARIYDSWHLEGRWQETVSDPVMTTHPILSEIPPPLHPKGGFFDQLGYRYTVEASSLVRVYGET